MNDTVKLSPPWETYAKMLAALFEEDHDIMVGDVDTEDGYKLPIYVEDHRKYEALCKLLPFTVRFGNVVLQLIIKDSNKNTGINYGQLFEDLFKGNPKFKEVKMVKDLVGADHTFVMFQPEVIQFFNDNMFDYNGFWSGLAQDIAKEVFEGATKAGVHFCTAPVR